MSLHSLRVAVRRLAPVALALACTVLASRTAAAQSAQPDTALQPAMRRAIAQRFPEALTGGLGAHPMVWILADARDSVLRSATGRGRLAHDSTGAETVTWTSAAAMLPGMPASASPGDLLEWGHVATGGNTVDVIWVRLATAAAAVR